MDPSEPLGRSDPRAKRLESFGYRVEFRSGGFSDCLLSRGPERWHGRGLDPLAAFENALSQAFPSHAARALLDESLAGAALPTRDEPAAIDVELARAVGGRVRSKDPERSAPRDALTVAAEPDVDATAGAEALRTVVVYPAPPPPRPPPNIESIDRGTALQRLEDLSDVISNDALEAPLWTPERQRLLLLGWIGHARGVQDASRGDREVRERVHEIASRISTLAKVWWPGSVHALRLDATPSDCAGDLEISGAEGPRTWVGIADAAEERLQTLAERDEVAGRDEFGWADAAALDPAPPQPDALLREVQHELEDRTAPIPPDASGAATARVPAKESASSSAWRKPPRREVLPASLEIGVCERLAAKVRWSRRSASDVASWGAAIGRLRRIAASLPVQRAARLAEILHPNYEPPRTWAQLLGYDPHKKARMRRRRDVLRAAPGAEAPIGTAELLDWLKRSFDLGDELKSAEIAEILAPHGALVLALEPDLQSDLDRAQRRRLRRVQDVLRRPSAADAAPAADAAHAADEQPSAEGDETIDGVEEAGARSLEDRLLTAILPKTRGADVLVVGNRPDPDLDRRLQETFEFGTLDRCDVSPRRVDSARERIAAGAYDFVLSATGFLPHKVDGVLKDACRSSETPYIRVRKGRNLACVLHLARELGVAAAAS